MTDIDTPIPEGYVYSHTIPTKAVLKKGISKKKGDPIYTDEIEYTIGPWTVYTKEDKQ